MREEEKGKGDERGKKRGGEKGRGRSGVPIVRVVANRYGVGHRNDPGVGMQATTETGKNRSP